MIRVYHAPDICPYIFDDMLRFYVRKTFPLYHQVAVVNTNSLDQAFLLTNTIEIPWWKNDLIYFLGSEEFGMRSCRSSSVGDVFQTNDRDYHIATTTGFMQIDL